jgi:DNA-binding NtrC family response regulator
VAALLTPEAIDVLLDYDWPGNVRELLNVMEHAYILAGGGAITPEHLPHTVRVPASEPLTLPLKPTPSGTTALSAPAPLPTSGPGPRTLREIEMEHVLKVLEKHNRNKPAAAAELGISLKTLYNKLNQLEEERRTAG